MKLTNEQVLKLYFEEEIEVDGVTLKVVEVGNFEQSYKFQTAELIFTDGNKYYRTYVTRCGSPFTDWEYDDWGDADVEEVEKREVTITQWVAV